ncbi:MAG TPA: PP2C family protein-serine/threonine phosphatase [Bacteroidia bacterium]|nr:PP2C family protein-serine/threonine phosphatase [Bacteroidia bacterium]
MFIGIGDLFKPDPGLVIKPKLFKLPKTKGDPGIMENLYYAKQVHNSFMTQEEEIGEIFPESFLIYNAQKIIGGDFYKVEKRENRSVIVMGDSTGHGISASYMSIMVLNIISRIMEKHCGDPANMLSLIHREILSATRQNKKARIIESADTMICTIDHTLKKMRYASAKMRGIILRKGKLIELKRDKCSIGEQVEKEVVIRNHEQDIEKGDCLYLFTDGVIDQFGGCYDKKFGYKKLIEILDRNKHLPFYIQKCILEKILSDWKGRSEQTDDVTLLAVKIG